MANSRQLIERLRIFNQERDPECLALKYQAMRRNSFAFPLGYPRNFLSRRPRRLGYNS